VSLPDFWAVPRSLRLFLERDEGIGTATKKYKTEIIYTLHTKRGRPKGQSSFLTESSQSPASIAKSNKQWEGICLYQKITKDVT